MIGVQAFVTLTVVLATSDPGYSKYFRLYNNREKGYSGYGSVSLTKQNYQNPYYRSLPSRRGKSYPHTHSTHRAYQNHPYYNEPLKYSRGGVKPHHYRGHHGKYNSYPRPINVPKPYPMPHPVPHPVPHPEPHPVPHPHPIPHPQPQPAPHPITIPKPVLPPQPEPVPQPQPAPQPIPFPLPTPIPHPHPAPIPIPQPAPVPAPQIPDEVIPDVVIEEDISIPSIPDFVRPLPVVEIPGIELPPEGIRPIRPIETIGRPPVAPSVKPPMFVELQRAVPGFVDIQRVKIRPLGEPAVFTPRQQINQFNNVPFQPPPPPTAAEQAPTFVETHPRLNSPVETLFPLDKINFERINSGSNTPIETLFPVDEVVVPVENKPIVQSVFESTQPNFPQIPLRNIPNPPLQNAVNVQRIPFQNVANTPLLAKAVPAVPESNPQPLFKNGNVAPETATATALLLKASMADFGIFPPPTPLETVQNNPRPPLQQIPSATPQIDFRRLPSVVLPDPVPAVPLTQP